MERSSTSPFHVQWNLFLRLAGLTDDGRVPKLSDEQILEDARKYLFTVIHLERSLNGRGWERPETDTGANSSTRGRQPFPRFEGERQTA
jgi:hypothetical protein